MRLLRRIRVDWAAIIMVVIACIAGWQLIANERDSRVDALEDASGNTRIVACANARFAGGFNDFLKGAANRTRQRIGTPNEISTDRASLESTEKIIAIFGDLGVSVDSVCGPQP